MKVNELNRLDTGQKQQRSALQASVGYLSDGLSAIALAARAVLSIGIRSSQIYRAP